MRVSASRRWLALAGATLMLVSACSSAATPAPTAAPTAAPAASAAASSAASAAPASAAARAKVCDAGKAEGKLVYWNLFSSPDKIVAEFNKVYPGIQVDLVSNHPDDLVQGLLTELAAGRKPTADMLYGELNVLQPVEAVKGVNTTIDWKSLGVDAGLLSPVMNSVRIFRVAMGLTYNTKLVKAADLPNTWAGLVDQKWKGQIVTDPRGRPFDQMSLIWGEEQTLNYVRTLKAINPLVIKGGTAGILAIASEQGSIVAGGRSAETAEQKSKGLPIELKFLDVIPTIDSHNIVTAGAQHPNAAACMVSWLANEGQAVHDKIEFKSNTTVPQGAPAETKYAEVITTDSAKTVAAIGKKIGDILTGITK